MANDVWRSFLQRSHISLQSLKEMFEEIKVEN